MTTVMRRQRLTRRASCTTLALRSTLGSTSGGITGGAATRSMCSSDGSIRLLASDAAIESDTSSGSSPTGGGTGIESAPGSSAMIRGGASAAGVSGGGVSAEGVGSDLIGSIAAAGASLGGATVPSSALILSHSSGGGSTASTMTLSSPSRRSHIRTDAAKPGSSVSNASACSRSSAESVPSTYSAASASWASSYITVVVLFSPQRSAPHTLANFEQAATQPCLDRVHRNIELGRELFAAPAAVIGEQHDALLFRVELAEAGKQPLELFGHLTAGERRRAFGGDVLRLRLFLDGDFAALAHDVDGAVARHGHHPGDRACQRRVELVGHFPDLEISLLHDLFSQFGLSQDTQKHPVEFRPGGAVKPFEGGLVALGDGSDEPDQFRLHQHNAPGPGSLPKHLALADYRRGGRHSSRAKLEGFGHSGAPQGGEPGIHSHRPCRICTGGDYGFRAPSGACHRAGHFGPDPLARPRNDRKGLRRRGAAHAHQ